MSDALVARSFDLISIHDIITDLSRLSHRARRFLRISHEVEINFMYKLLTLISYCIHFKCVDKEL